MTDIDGTDRNIIEILAADARKPVTEIAALVGLSASAVNDRVRRLGAQGVVRRFTVDLDPEAIGLPILALIWVVIRYGAEEEFRNFARSHPGMTECHHVTGPWSYLIHLRCEALDGVERFLSEMKQAGLLDRSETMLALSTIRTAPVLPPGAAR